MYVLEFLPFGILIGLLGSMLAARKRRDRWLMSMLLGAAGALVGGLFGRFLALSADEAPQGFALSLLGAFVVVAAYHALLIVRVRA
jgi:uncharacterized membrane protein YeaQ/YmgE (transglycosylase-associated protein family)